MISITQFIKKMISIDGIWGARTKKASGIQDRFNTITEQVVFTAPSTITFVSPVPEWMKAEGLNGKAIRVMNDAAHPNSNKKYYVTAILGPNTVSVSPANPAADGMVSFTGLTKISGRIWEVVADENLCGRDREGNTIFNTHHQEKGANDGGDVSLVHFDHYHGRIVTGEYNSAGWPQVEIQYAPVPDGMGGYEMRQVTGPVRAEVVTAIDGRVVKA